MKPPRLASLLLDTVLPRELRDDVLGDLQEGFVARQSAGDPPAARRWYWRQALQSLRYARGDNAPDPLRGRRPPRLQRALMGFFRYDVAYALRQLRANPGFTAVAVLSLALGIGVNSVIFSLVNGFMLKPLPVRDIDEVVEVFTSRGNDNPFNTSSYPDYLDYRAEVDAFQGLAAEMTMIYGWNRETHSESLFGALVSDNYFDVLGIEPALGRFFLPEENATPGTHPVAVLSHGFWEREFGADHNIIGSTIKLNGTHFTVVGIAPPEFNGTMPVVRMDLWTPLMTEPVINMFIQDSNLLESRGTRSLRLYGRLADGAGIEQAEAQLATVATRLAAAYAETNEERQASVKPLREIRIHPVVDRMVTPIAGLLMGLVGLVLVVACANVANMLLARASMRGREIGVRLAVGASRWRLVRQLLTESVMLSLIGGAVALLVTSWVSRLLMSYQPPIPVIIAFDVSPDYRVLLFTLGASLLTGIVFGLAPALRSSRTDLVSNLRADTNVTGDRGGTFTLRNALVVAQVAVSLMLLVTAGLFARSLANAETIDLGFDESNIAFVSMSLSTAGYESEEGRLFLRQLTERLDGMPEVTAAAYTARLPMSLTNATQGFFIEGYEPDDSDPAVAIEYNTVGPRYFEILGVPMLAGREILPSDDSRAPLVAVVNQEFVERYWPGQNALGKRIRFDGESEPWIEVVGVSGNYKMSSVGEELQPIVHTSLLQQDAFFETVMVRTASDPAPMVARLRDEITALDPDISFFDARTMHDNMAVVLFPVRMGAAMLGAFGLLALGLAAVGVYGVIAFAVSRRTHEIGIRMALGAGTRDVLGLVLWQGMRTVTVGVVVGLLGAVALSSALGGLLYGVSTVDPIAFLGTVAILVGVALLANYIPARRGAHVDPMVALRSE